MKGLLHILLPVCYLIFLLPYTYGNNKKYNTDQLIHIVELLDRQGHRDSSYTLLSQAQKTISPTDSFSYLQITQAIAEHFEYYGEMDSLKRYAEKSLRLAHHQQLPDREIRALLLLTNRFLWKEQFPKALKYCERAISMARVLGNQQLEGLSLYWMGIVLRRTRGRMGYPIDYFNRAHDIFTQVADTSMMIRSALMIISGHYDNGTDNKEWIKRAAELSDLYPNIVQRIGLLNTRAANLPTKESLPLLEEALALCKKVNMPEYIRHIHLQLCSRYQSLGQFDKALKSLRMGIDASDIPLGDSSIYYYHIYKGLGQLEKAIIHNDQHREWERQQKTKQIQSLVSEWETKLNIKEKEWLLTQQTELLVAQKRQSNLYLIILFLSLIAMALAFWAYFSQVRTGQRLSRQKNIIEQQAIALRKLDKLKSNFFANISHELRTPLSLMMGPLSSILNHNQLTNQDFTLIKLIQQNGHVLLKLVNEILDINKLEAGKMQLNESNILFYPLVRRILAAFESFAEKKGISIHYNYQIDRQLKLRLDIDKMEKILNNLLSNAIKFTPVNGQIIVRVSDKDNYIQLEVIDSGRGIHPDDLPHIFNRFYQSNQPDAPIEGGTGIGLAICQEFATLLKGHIRAESTLDRGSRFILELPKQEVMGAVMPLPQSLFTAFPEAERLNLSSSMPASEVKADNPTLLIVEDSYSLRDYLQYILNNSYHTIAVENGQVALDILTTQSSTIDLIISDVMMPRKNGFEVVKEIREELATSHIPVIMLTARAESEDRLRALRIGVDDYLIKPFIEEELMARIENLLNNHSFRKQAQLEAPPSASAISLKDQEWLIKLEQVIDIKLGQFGLTAEEVAREMTVSRAQLFRQLKKLTGLTPAQYLTEARLCKARNLLENKYIQTVKAAAYEAGFRQVKHFSRQFKKRFGKLPSEYLSQ